MSARAATTFQAAFDAFARLLNFTPAAVAANATLQASLLQIFNRAYARGYGKRLWEDAWDGATKTPVSRLIAWDAIGDSRRFEIWNADPRDPENGAYELRYTTTLNGALLMSAETSVFVLSMPNTPKFTTTAWNTTPGTAYAVGDLVLISSNVYRCLVAHNSNASFATDLGAGKWILVPVLGVLEEFTIAYARGTYLLENGQPETGRVQRDDALLELETLAMTEYARAATGVWRPKP